MKNPTDFNTWVGSYLDKIVNQFKKSNLYSSFKPLAKLLKSKSKYLQIIFKTPTDFKHKPLARILVIVGVSLCLISVFNNSQQLIANSVQNRLAADLSSAYQQRPPKPIHIYIPWKVDVGIKQQAIVNHRWSFNPDFASHLFTSARPGEPGNIIIYGHNKRQILGNIRALKLGDKITLITADEHQHHYQVTAVEQVSASQTKYLSPTEKEMLTVYTCSGFADRHRFVVRAAPVNQMAEN